jgi:excisionase family DNA binding protein
MKYITIPQLAKMLNVSRVTVFRWVKSGKIKASKVGGTWIIDDPDILSTITGELTDAQKAEIAEAVDKAVEQYGELFRLLSKQ